jgi:glucose-6-phosphate isomerase
MSQRTALPAWQALRAHAAEIERAHLRDLFDADPARFDALHLESLDLLFDYSRQRLSRHTLTLLVELARACRLEERIAALFAGGPVNVTEHRAAMHMALRNRSGRPMPVEGRDVMPAVKVELGRMRDFVTAIHEGRITGHRGARYTDVVNIGIGGSDLGIVMATEALGRYRNRAVRLHCVSNIDGAGLSEVLEEVDPGTTLFVVCSKTFTTQETLSNTRIARDWLVEALGEAAVKRQFVAVSTNAAAMDAFGIDPERRFTMWDWVGGRYSLWSAVGLSIALALGMEPFEEMLAGGHDMDGHFRSAPLAANLPVLMGLIGVWNTNFLGATSLAVLPYDSRLHRFPAYLQQLEMESNGKGVTRDGVAVDYPTGTVIWGEPGNNAQHSFFQLLHQGTARLSMDFLAPVNASSRFEGQQALALANCFAQAEAFAFGKTEAQVCAELASTGMDDEAAAQLAPHKAHPGNRPCSLILFPRLTPRMLGRLVAWYEHKVYVQSVVWDVNPFDQWGVELGKHLAVALVPAVESGAATAQQPRLSALLEHVRQWRGPGGRGVS